MVLIAVGIIGWSLMATNAEQDFSSRLTEAKKTIASELNDQVNQLPTVVKANDTGKTSEFLSSFASAVDADVVNIPQQTYFAGLPLVGAARLNQADEIKTKLDNLATALHNSAGLLGYMHNVVEPLAGANNLVGNDVASQTQMAKTWADLETQVKAMQVADTAKDVHATVVNLVTSIHLALEQLPQATQKNNQGLQKAISDALQGYVGQIKALGPTFSELTKQADSDFQKAFTAAQDVLQ